MDTSIAHKIATNGKPIKKILVMRLQAGGDVLITLSYLQDMRDKLAADVQIDFLTRKETESVPRALIIFHQVFALGGGRNTKLQFLSFLFLLPQLFFKRYDVLIDLQNHKLSKWIRLLLQIKTYTLFDKYSPVYAGDRNKHTINILKLAEVEFSVLKSFKGIDTTKLFKKFNLSKEQDYIVINPAGAFENRNWDLDNYVEFCLEWNKTINTKTKFLILGIDKIKSKSLYLRNKLGNQLIDLVGQTEMVEAMHILKHAKLVVSEDSGLLHAAYIVGTPTVGILGSTRNDWTNPNLPHTYFFNSSDLPCGNCMLEKCKFDEVKCLKRIAPQAVLDVSIKLLNNKN